MLLLYWKKSELLKMNINQYKNMNMKKVILFAICLAVLLSYPAFIFSACSGTPEKQTVNTNSNPIDYMNIQEKSFEELFTRIEPAEFRKTLSKFVAEEDHTVITAGTEFQFNSMAASWEALGHYFEKPMTFCLLGAEKYTLKFIKERKTYTMSFLPEQFKGDLYAFGAKSGRGSDKMKETKLTYVETPSGNITYKEAKVVVECQLFEITTVNPNDFYTEDGRSFVEKANTEGHDYHKLVFGVVTNIWVRK